ncbi:MAG: hypothetical protein J7K26_01810 [Candidatus Aenigmarchaeota archaeon]|nr:hypothetical protein [Candidatus Aenigmarchaeota archaeon]
MQLSKLIENIKSIKIQGATQIAIEALKFLKTQPYSKWGSIQRKLEKIRPTGVVLHNALELAKKERDVNKIINKLRTARKKLAEKGSKLIRNNYKIMTKCHSSDVTAVLKHAKRQGKNIIVYALETEPKHQGILTAKELSKHGIKTVVIEDPACGFFMPKMDIVMVGADSIRMNKSKNDILIINKIGTYVLALVSKKHKKPFYVIGTSFKLDKRKNIEIEERPAEEVYAGLKETKYLKVRNPAFDITPGKELVTRVVTEKGIMTIGNILKLLKEK